jgi:hypothetical protein
MPVTKSARDARPAPVARADRMRSTKKSVSRRPGQRRRAAILLARTTALGLHAEWFCLEDGRDPTLRRDPGEGSGAKGSRTRRPGRLEACWSEAGAVRLIGTTLAAGWRPRAVPAGASPPRSAPRSMSATGRAGTRPAPGDWASSASCSVPGCGAHRQRRQAERAAQALRFEADVRRHARLRRQPALQQPQAEAPPRGRRRYRRAAAPFDPLHGARCPWRRSSRRRPRARPGPTALRA